MRNLWRDIRQKNTYLIDDDFTLEVEEADDPEDASTELTKNRQESPDASPKLVIALDEDLEQPKPKPNPNKKKKPSSCIKKTEETKDILSVVQETKDLTNVKGPPYKCPICKYFYSKVKHKFFDHLNHHLKNSEQFKCENCRRFVTFERSRFEIHKGKCNSLYQLTCDKCDFATMKNSHLMKHIALKHPKKRQKTSDNHCFQCKLCDFETNKRSRLKVHASKKHNDVITIN